MYEYIYLICVMLVTISIVPSIQVGISLGKITKSRLARLQSQLQRILLRSSYVRNVLGYRVISVSIVSQVRHSGTWLVKAL